MNRTVKETCIGLLLVRIWLCLSSEMRPRFNTGKHISLYSSIDRRERDLLFVSAILLAGNDFGRPILKQSLKNKLVHFLIVLYIIFTMTSLATMLVICLCMPIMVVVSLFAPISFDLSTDCRGTSPHDFCNFSKTFSLI